MAQAHASCWPTCSASSAPGRHLLQLQHQVNGGRRRAAVPTLATTTPGTHQLLADRRRHRANPNTSARSAAAAGARGAALAMATAITSCRPTCSASSAPGRHLLQLQHQVNGGRRARAAGALRHGAELCQLRKTHHKKQFFRDCTLYPRRANDAERNLTASVELLCTAENIICGELENPPEGPKSMLYHSRKSREHGAPS